MKKTMLTILAVAFVSGSMFAGCASNKGAEAGDESTPAQQEEPKKEEAAPAAEAAPAPAAEAAPAQ